MIDGQNWDDRERHQLHRDPLGVVQDSLGSYTGAEYNNQDSYQKERRLHRHPC